jgi:DNA excision repair protein ERCC-6
LHLIDAQARERAWRFGQEKEVVIFRLISAGTVEEKIYQRQIFKTALSNKVLQDARQRRLFSQKDLKDLFSLKADSGSVISGSDGLTETGELTKGDGYVDPDEDPSTTVSSDDGETMRTVLKSRGLAGVFDHGIVENHDVVKKASVREMEAKAKRIAREAASSLQESVTEQQSFTPTWTGSVETQGGRFGSSMPSGVASAPRSAATRAGISMSSTKASSDSLLASIRERNQDLSSNGERKVSDAKQYTDLLKRIQDFVKREAPKTDEILHEFESVSTYDAAIFRRLLKSIAKCDGGRWRLK